MNGCELKFVVFIASQEVRINKMASLFLSGLQAYTLRRHGGVIIALTGIHSTLGRDLPISVLCRLYNISIHFNPLESKDTVTGQIIDTGEPSQS